MPKQSKKACIVPMGFMGILIGVIMGCMLGVLALLSR